MFHLPGFSTMIMARLRGGQNQAVVLSCHWNNQEYGDNKSDFHM